ncbi:hypothetical protein EG028_13255 [Chitinophaga barathri]|uniref:Uncharacterized protein n=1 Tax=Chitinophaga barathri TaxID=1647451 RepID=A0A3N4MG45_9BACT|nr:hypothetical protein EG028_13255 [Chitinophaga barathri]
MRGAAGICAGAATKQSPDIGVHLFDAGDCFVAPPTLALLLLAMTALRQPGALLIWGINVMISTEAGL